MTVARVLTPAGRGAIAVIEVTGANALRAVDACFSPAGGKPLAASAADRIRFGSWGGPGGEEVVVVATSKEHQTAEVHCHGGLAATRAILESLNAKGVGVASTEQTSGSLAEDALTLLTTAPTERVAGILLDQANGAFASAVDEALHAVRAGDEAAALSTIRRPLDHSRLARLLARPSHVVITGPPNVGKSSLINALVGYDRAVVFDQPGTTRDVVTASTAINGWPVEFADTAGIRRSDDPLEQAGVELAQSELASADVIVRVRDARDDAFEPSACDTPVVLVANKADLAPDAALSPTEVATVATTGEGVAALLERIDSAIDADVPPAGEAVPFREWHLVALQKAEKALEVGDSDAATEALLALHSGSGFAG